MKDLEFIEDIRVKHVVTYCYPNLDQMWAAVIVSTLLGCDFRDSKEHAEKYFKFVGLGNCLPENLVLRKKEGEV